MTGKDDKLIKTKALLSTVENWGKFLMSGLSKDVVDDIWAPLKTQSSR
ncbi:MAG: hypothetical protein ABH886_04660 [Candidatus Desantisbacteria bacterium]